MAVKRFYIAKAFGCDIKDIINKYFLYTSGKNHKVFYYLQFHLKIHSFKKINQSINQSKS